MADAGMHWIALNVGDYDPSAWNRTRQRAAAASPAVEVIPWARLAHPPGEGMSEARAKLSRIVSSAKVWGSRAILPNLEKEAEREAPPAQVRDALDALDWQGEVAWSTLGWLPNAVDFSPLSDAPVLLQVFASDMRFDPALAPEKARECTYHARVDKGFTYVGVTFQAYHSVGPPAWEGTRSYFTADDIGYGKWGPWAV